MEDYGYQYIHILPQFIATKNSRNNRSIDMKPYRIKHCDFMLLFHSKPFRDYAKPQITIGGRVCISKYVLTFRKGYNHNLHRNFLKLLPLATQKPPPYSIEDEKEEVIGGKIQEKEMT